MGAFLISHKQDNLPVAQRGDIVEIRHGTLSNGADSITDTEKLTFCLVKIPDRLMHQIAQYAKPWFIDLDYEVLNHQLSTDGYRIRAYSTTYSSGGSGGITREKIEAYLNKWNAIVQSVGVNEVVFDFSIFGLVSSQEFWEDQRKVDVSLVDWEEISYDQGTGIHRISADYSAETINPSFVETWVRKRLIMYEGDEDITPIVSHANKVIVFDISRDAILRFFKWKVKDKVKELVAKRRYRVSNAVVDYILGEGGVITADWVTVQGYLIDKLET